MRNQLMYETKTDAKVRGFLAHSKKNARFLSELLRQAWCFATDQEMKGCECRIRAKKGSAHTANSLCQQSMNNNRPYYRILFSSCAIGVSCILM